MSGICENCGGIIKGTGTRYCSYCRNSREVKNNYPNQRRAIRREKNFSVLGMCFLLLALFVTAGIIIALWKNWKAWIIGMPIIVVLAFLLWKISKYYLDLENKMREVGR